MPGDYYIAAAYLRLVLQGGVEVLELAPEELGAELVKAAQAEYVPGRLINQLYEVLEDHGFDSWVTRYGAQIGVGSHGPLGFAALSAADLGTALATLAEFLVIRSSAFDTCIRERQNRLQIILHDNTGHPVAGRWLIESGFLIVKGLIETITLHPLGDNGALHFAYPKITNHHEIERLFKIECVYAATENSLSIPAAWARIPSPLSDHDAFLSNVAKCREIRLSLDKDRSDVLKLVNARLLNHFERRMSNQPCAEKIPGLEALAAEFYMSPRTLIRKLERQGSSYKKVLEEVRLEQAQELLTQTHFTAAEIAGKLGYMEPANFNRAFKRWTGQTPTAWRRHS